MSAELDTRWAIQRLRQLAAPLGLPLVHSSTTRSTNDDAKRAASEGAPHGACFVTELQTHGRGRRGRSWLTAPGEGLLFSFVLRPLRLVDPSPVTLCVGLGVHEAVQRHVSVPLRIKWPNDLVCGQKKLAGILVESELSSETPAAIIVGIGVNVLGERFAQELEPIATSLRQLDATVTREQLLVDVLASVGRWYERFTLFGVASLLDDLRRLDALNGVRIRVDGVEGRGAGFDDTGHLLLERADGTLVTLTAGSVEFVDV